jgi:hypothetical protein
VIVRVALVAAVLGTPRVFDPAAQIRTGVA